MNSIQAQKRKVRGVPVYLLDYQDCFAALWNQALSGNSTEFDLGNGVSESVTVGSGDSGSRVIVLIVDEALPTGAPESVNRVSPRRYLSALVWAAVWRLRFPKGTAGIIVSQSVNGEELTLAKLVLPLLDREEHNVIQPGIVPGVLQVTDENNTAFFEGWIVGPVNLPTHAQLDALRALLQSGVNGDPENHHELANIAGALFLRHLANSYQTAVGHPVEWAIWRLLEALTCLLEGSLSKSAKQQWWTGATNQYLLLDDMSELWKPFLEGALLTGPNDIHAPLAGTGLRGGSGALSHLVSRLECFAEEPYTRRFLTLCDFVPTAPDTVAKLDCILFLDLRFFTRAQAGDSSLYHSRLRVIAKDLENSVLNSSIKPAWEMIPHDAHELGLLPRLLSLFDPTLPIVIFSSSNQRSIVADLEKCGNIITDFQKPIFRAVLGDATEYVDHIRHRFRSSMKKATRILKVRQSLRQLTQMKP
ncbi:MAG: hypothetical protein SFY81_08325 [Verrucomicrobiota bacterium]|nr:hypothetical protein [Verrucomicrobiota bacterium]